MLSCVYAMRVYVKVTDSLIMPMNCMRDARVKAR
jgi:hypothetical protein